jgi:putative GTP pyrophosphokinase
MNQNEFQARYEAEIPMFEAWGEYVKDTVINKLKEKVCVDLFLKVPSTPRVKEVKSIIAKAFYRDKNYENPYNDITDKVGVRFVVLLIKDINTIADIIAKNDIWTASKDRDFIEERMEHPSIFEYQSVHYVVKNKEPITYNEQTINPGTPCEIQIRTLLQHAYSELTHDTVYKPKVRATPEIYRYIARSMALIETTDTIFEEVNDVICSKEENIKLLLTESESKYTKIAAPNTEKTINSLLVDAYLQILENIKVEDLHKFIEKHGYIQQIIERKYSSNLLFRQPIIIILLYLVKNYKYIMQDLWPLTQRELEPLFIEMGIAFGKEI